jgi:hypothetical protein
MTGLAGLPGADGFSVDFVQAKANTACVRTNKTNDFLVLKNFMMDKF